MRRAARADANQAEVIRALRQIGATVLPMHALGKGAPDVLAGYRGVNYALEIKDGSKPPSARALTPDEADWHADWRGQVAIVESVADALRVIGAER